MERTQIQDLGWVTIILPTVAFLILPSAAHANNRVTVCSEGTNHTQAAVASDPRESMIPAQLLLPVGGYPELQVRILETSNYSPEQAQKLERIIPLMQQALNSEALREFVLNHVYRGKKQFSDNEGQTNEQIYEKMRLAVEELFENERYVAELRTELYYTRKRTVGYTSASWPSWIMSNTKYFNPWSPAEVAGHLTHEWLHLIGFSHYQTFDYSVPYAIGEEVARIASELMKE